MPNRGIWGTAGIDGANIDTGIANEGDYLKVRPSSAHFQLLAVLAVQKTACHSACPSHDQTSHCAHQQGELDLFAVADTAKIAVVDCTRHPGSGFERFQLLKLAGRDIAPEPRHTRLDLCTHTHIHVVNLL